MQIFNQLQNNVNKYIVTSKQNHENKPGTAKQIRINTRTTQQDKNPETVRNLTIIKFSNFVPK